MAKQAEGMHLFLLDGSGILFSETRQEIHTLNASATVIWRHLENRKNTREMVTELVETFGLKIKEAEQFVATALEDWRRLGFLAGGETAANGDASADKDEQPKPELPAWTDGPFVAERTYRLLSSRLRLRFTTKEQETVVHPIFAHLERQTDGAAPETLIDMVAAPQGIVLYRDKEAVASCRAIDELAPVAKGLVWMTAVEEHSFFLDIHAGVVRHEGGCILLPAPPGSGKSTLTAALVNAGFQFFSDEVALLEEGSFNVFPLPLAFCFKDTGIDAVSAFFPEVKTLPLHNRGDGKRVCYMPPPAHALPAGPDSQPVQALVFPRYQPNAATQFERMDTGEALKLLMEECIVVDKRLDRQKVAGLIDWIVEVGSYRLVYSDTLEAVGRIRSL